MAYKRIHATIVLHSGDTYYNLLTSTANCFGELDEVRVAKANQSEMKRNQNGW
jgi:hypothetical protein